MQCTKTCTADTDCESLVPGAFCIGAMVCVRACITDSDCPTLTHCTDNKWCERTGPGSGVPYCGGTATPCALLTSTTCYDSLGCSMDGTCSGVATGCFGIFDELTCLEQQGCIWDSSLSECSGAADSCDGMIGQFTCTGQQGCSWDASCSGTPLPCSTTAVSLCTQTPGCQLLQ